MVPPLVSFKRILKKNYLNDNLKEFAKFARAGSGKKSVSGCELRYFPRDFPLGLRE